LSLPKEFHLLFSTHRRSTVLLALGLAATAVMIWVAVGRPDAADAGPVASAQITEVSPDQAAAFAALRQPAALDVPDAVREWATKEPRRQLGLNPALVRTLAPPSGSTADPWYLIPGNGMLCLYGDSAATCQTTEQAASHGLSLQFIPPYGNSPTTPLPPQGVPVESTFVGIVPDSVTSVRAVTNDGGESAQPAANGMFKIAATDVQELSLSTATRTSSVAAVHQ
jgi:hypothetical protein